MLISLKHRLLLLLLVAGAATATAQKLPVPGEKNPEWVLRELTKPEQHDVFSYQPDANVRQTMPIMKVYGSQTDPKTGAILTLFDPNNKVWYDLEKGVLHDFQNNKTYQFYKKGEKPKTEISTP